MQDPGKWAGNSEGKQRRNMGCFGGLDVLDPLELKLIGGCGSLDMGVRN